jgi:hypothetical protein
VKAYLARRPNAAANKKRILPQRTQWAQKKSGFFGGEVENRPLGCAFGGFGGSKKEEKI